MTGQRQPVVPRHHTSLRDHGPRHSRHGRRGHPFLRGVAVTAVAALAFGVSGAAAVYRHADANIHHVSVAALVDQPTGPADPNAGKSLNILLLGSDSRAGENGAIGGSDATTGGMRSDTAIIMHVSSDRKRVELVSIPRDSLVNIPACRTTSGKTTPPASNAMFNSAFARGWDTGGDMASAAACTINTVQANTPLRISYYMVVDFAGFQQMVDAVGGVDVCIDHDMRDKQYTGLNLTAGMHHLDGVTALQFARARHVTGSDGSDTDRIQHQQQLLGALAHEALAQNAVTQGGNLLGFVSAATSSLTTDLSTPTILGLVTSMRSISSNNIVFTTIPWGPDARDPNRVRWTSQAADVWAAMAADRPIADVLTPPAPTTSPAPPTGSPQATQDATPAPEPTPTGLTSVTQVQQDAAQVCGS